MVKKKQTSAEIAEGLKRGGMESTARNFAQIVHSGLDRARKAANSAIIKLGRSHWGLTEWYPKGVASVAPAASKRGKKKQSRTAKSETKALKSNSQTPPATLQIQPAAKANVRALAFLQSKPGSEYSLTDVATHLGIGPRGTRLILGKLVKANQVRLSAPDTYTVAPFPATAAVS
jgi:hypothetical protein